MGPILAAVGDIVPVGEVVAYILEPGEKLSTELSMKRESPEVPVSKVSSKKTQVEVTPKVKASPLARRVAQETGVDISLVKGSGPGGRITKEDVLDLPKRPRQVHVAKKHL